MPYSETLRAGNMSRTITVICFFVLFLSLLTVSAFSSAVFAEDIRSDASIANISKISAVSEVANQYTASQYAMSPVVPAAGGFGGFGVGYSSSHTSDVSPADSTGNPMICSNQPSGKYCEDWESSCKQVSGANIGERFYVYYRITNSVHNKKVDVTHYSDAEDPDGNNICWGSGCIDRNKADIKFDCDCSWVCTWWWFELSGKPGKWNVFFDINDNIDKSSAKLDTYPEMWCKSSSDCSGASLCANKQCVKCGAKSESAWVHQNSGTCDGNLVTKHKFSNTGGSD